MSQTAAVYAIIAVGVFSLLAMIGTGLGLWAFANAIAYVHRSRSWSAQADAGETISREGKRLETPPAGVWGRSDFRMPTDEELRQFAREEYDDTDTNAGVSERNDMRNRDIYAPTGEEVAP